MKIPLTHCCALATCVVAGATTAQAQNYPERTVRFVSASAGSPQDVVGRLFAQKISEGWGQAIVVDNRAGAGALISIQAAVKAPPDGYTVLLSSSAFAVTPYLYPAHGYDAERDFIALALLATTPNIFVTSPGTGIKSLKELVVRSRAAQLQYGSPGFGTTPQLSAEYLFKSLAKIQILHVPYKGIPPVMAAALAGEVDVATTSLPPTVGLIKTGKLIGLAVTSARRSPAVADVPTIAEAGFTGFEDESWVGAWVPAGTPAPVVARLREELERAGAASDLREKLRNVGFDAGGIRSDAFAPMVRRELDKWARVVKETGARVE